MISALKMDSRLGCLLLVLPWLVGCGQQAVTTITTTVSAPALQGHVYSGRQPVIGATVALYAAGSAGDGQGAVSLSSHTTTTNSIGAFSLSIDSTCPSATTQVYAVARGGNPSLPNNSSNSALVMMTALGDCGGLSTSTSFVVNEVTTAAAAWALAPFLAPSGLVGASSTNAMGLRNAFLSAANLASSTTGAAPGTSLPASAVTESEKLNTLANALNVCADSDGTSACALLFAASNTAASSTASNTLDAARAIVLHPGLNIASVYKAAPAQGPFQPSLAVAPHDWSMSVTYGNCTSGCGGLDLPGALALDSTGAVWAANYFNGVVSKFSSTGVPAAANGFPGTGLRESYGIAVDASDNAWVVNELSVTGANNSHSGSVSKFSSAGAELSGYGFTVGGIFYPQAIATDALGPVWTANYGNSSATLLANDGSALSPSGYAVSALPFTSAVAIDASHNAWFAVQTAVAEVTPGGAVTTFPCCQTPTGIAVDASGNVWVADYGASSVVQLSHAGAVLTRTSLAGGAVTPQLLAIDGAGSVWTSNYRGNSVSQLASATGSVISPTLGYGLDAPLDEPYGIAVDASGNLWVSNSDGNTLTQFVGIAQPVRTPMLGPPVQP